PADILALATHFARKYADVNGVPVRQLGESAKRTLMTHQWRGNVRELENTIHRAVLLAQGPEIEEAAIRLPDGSRVGDVVAITAPGVVARAAQAAESVNREMVGRTVA